MKMLKAKKTQRWFAKATLAIGVVTMLTAIEVPVIAAETDPKVARIEELLSLTNASDMGIQVMESMVEQFKLAGPEVPDEWWDGFMAKVTAEDLDNLIVPIYARNFTDAEIDAMIAFYETPEGRSVMAKMPTVMQESMMAGQMWGASLAEELLRELEADGYNLQTSMPKEMQAPELQPERTASGLAALL